MIKKEIAKLFGLAEVKVHQIFWNAAKDDSPMGRVLKQKNGKSTKVMVIDYTFEECDFALSFFSGYNAIMRQVLKENFVFRNGTYLNKREKKKRLPRDVRNFLSLCKLANGKRRVCATCAFLAAKKMDRPGSKDYPYCNLYKCFLTKAHPKRNIYKDRCPAHVFSESEPLIFTEDGLIQEPGKTLGIKNENFTTGKTKKGKPVILLSTIELSVKT